MSSLNTLSAAAEDRKSRLAALRNLKRKHDSNNDTNNDVLTADSTDPTPSEPIEIDVSKVHLSGRNYDAETRGPKLGFDQAPNEGLDQPTLEEQAAEVESKLREQAAEQAKDDKGLDLFKLQPKKPNWDLKRDLQPKLDVLSVRTENAIARLVRERINGAQKAAAAKNSTVRDAAQVDGDGVGMDGAALVEGLRVREQEEEEEERRERWEDEAMMA
ncbi:hypothetical protein E4U30_001227 [Claviceps sp. LM220 group G6]|nr:hypothetical protein E4U30_001227 [Claviceps sp. LM220 group G6]KAG6121090.1 hypothetical protein E4U14_002531 [Claviceps sp. LM454 group G7]